VNDYIADLRDVGWSPRAQQLTDWHRFITTSPSKLLSLENTLPVHSAHSSAVAEVVEGVDKGLQLFRKLIDRIKQLRGTGLAREKLRVIREELLPLIDKLKQFGASEERINKMIEKALVYVDEVLTELTAQKKLKIT
jgi:squalene cyclase